MYVSCTYLIKYRLLKALNIRYADRIRQFNEPYPFSMRDVSNSVRRKIHFRIVEIEYLVIVVSLTKRLASSFASSKWIRRRKRIEGRRKGRDRKCVEDFASEAG